MDWTLIKVFLGLSITLGPLVGLGTLSLIRGVFIFLLFQGLAFSAYLAQVGMGEVLSYFVGQAIIMGSVYMFLRIFKAEILTQVEQEFSKGKGGGCHS
jgi:hypothetical protein